MAIPCSDMLFVSKAVLLFLEAVAENPWPLIYHEDTPGGWEVKWREDYFWQKLRH